MTDTTNTNTRHWGLVAYFLGLSAWERVVYVSKLYRNLMPRLIMGALLLFGLGVWFNYGLEHKEWNVILMLLSAAVWLFLTFHPKPVILVLALGGIRGLPDVEIERIIKNFDLPNFELHKVAEEAIKQFESYVRLTAHGALFWVTAFGLLSLFQLEQGWAAFGALAFLIGTGIWAIVYKAPAGIYKWTTAAIMTFGLIALTVTAYRYVHPQDNTTNSIERALMERADAQKNARAEVLLARIDKGENLSDAEWEELNTLQSDKDDHRMANTAYEAVRQQVYPIAYSSTKEVTVTSTAEQRVCGIEPGNRSFTIPTVFIRQDGGSYELTSYIRINGQPGERSSDNRSFSGTTRVRGDGCVKLTFAMGRATFQKQTLGIIFR